jgi:hypothetical protein
MELQHTIIGVVILLFLWSIGRKSSNKEYDNEDFKNGSGASDNASYHNESNEKSSFTFFTNADEDHYQDINN